MAAKHWHQAGFLAQLCMRPPDVSVRIFPGIHRDFTAHEMEDWLRTDEASGFWVCDTAWPDDLRPDANGHLSCHSSELGWDWKFTSSETAERFREKFVVSGRGPTLGEVGTQF